MKDLASNICLALKLSNTVSDSSVLPPNLSHYKRLELQLVLWHESSNFIKYQMAVAKYPVTFIIPQAVLSIHQ